jgi:hypothetical protein
MRLMVDKNSDPDLSGHSGFAPTSLVRTAGRPVGPVTAAGLPAALQPHVLTPCMRGACPFRGIRGGSVGFCPLCYELFHEFVMSDELQQTQQLCPITDTDVAGIPSGLLPGVSREAPGVSREALRRPPVLSPPGRGASVS